MGAAAVATIGLAHCEIPEGKRIKEEKKRKKEVGPPFLGDQPAERPSGGRKNGS